MCLLDGVCSGVLTQGLVRSGYSDSENVVLSGGRLRARQGAVRSAQDRGGLISILG